MRPEGNHCGGCGQDFDKQIQRLGVQKTEVGILVFVLLLGLPIINLIVLIELFGR